MSKLKLYRVGFIDYDDDQNYGDGIIYVGNDKPPTAKEFINELISTSIKLAQELPCKISREIALKGLFSVSPEAYGEIMNERNRTKEKFQEILKRNNCNVSEMSDYLFELFCSYSDHREFLIKKTLRRMADGIRWNEDEVTVNVSFPLYSDEAHPIEEKSWQIHER